MYKWEIEEVKKYDYLYKNGYPVGPVKSFLRWINEVCPDALSEDKMVLDVGCGSAPMARNNKYIGFDFCAEAIKNARKKNPDALLFNCSVSDFYVEEYATVDTIFCCDVMEHIPAAEVNRTLEKIASFGGKEILFSIAYKPAGQKDHEGNDPHVTLLAPEIWVAKLSRYFNIKKTYLRKERNLFVYSYGL